MELSGQLHPLAAVIQKKIPGTCWIGGRVGLRAGLDAVGKTKETLSLPLSEIEPR
jgi:hypothetical protein